MERVLVSKTLRSLAKTYTAGGIAEYVLVGNRDLGITEFRNVGSGSIRKSFKNVAKMVRNPLLYKMIKLVELMCWARIQKDIRESHRPQIILGDGAPLINMMGCGIRYHRHLGETQMQRRCKVQFPKLGRASVRASILAVATIFLPMSASAHNAFDFGGSVQFANWAQTNTDLDTDVADNLMFNTFRFQLHAEGKLQKNITVYLRLEYEDYLSEGGEYGVVKNSGDWHDVNVNYAWVKYDSIWGKPLTLDLGRIPIRYGKGLVVHDYYDGFDGVSFSASFSSPAHKTELDIFGVKAIETRTPSANYHGGDNNLEGIVATHTVKSHGFLVQPYGIRNIQYALEGVRKGYSYNFYGLRCAYKTSGPVEYWVEFVQETGEDTSGGAIDAVAVAGGISLKCGQVAPVKLIGDYYYSTRKFTIREHAAFWGERATLDLVPSWGLVQSAIFPEYGLNPGRLGNLQLLDLACEFQPWSSITAVLEFMRFYTTSIGPVGHTDLGNELDLTFLYHYSESTRFQLSTGLFWPGKAMPGLKNNLADIGVPAPELKDYATAVIASVNTNF